MADISLELIGRRLDAIQTELREFKFGVDVDRRDAASWRTNLIIEVAAKLATFELHIDNRLVQMDERLADVDGRLAEMGGRLAEMGGRLAEVGGRLAEIGERLAEMDGRLARMEAMLQQILNK